MNDTGRILCWVPEFATGIDELDGQHRRLIEIINALVAHSRRQSERPVEEILAELQDYTRYHFETEEQLMACHPVSSEHRIAHMAAHRGFISHLERIVSFNGHHSELAVENLLAFLFRWLVHHITHMDVAMAREVCGGEPAGLQSEQEELRSLVATANELYEGLGRRSLELLEANERLSREVEERRGLEQRFRDLVNSTDGIVWEADATTFAFTFVSAKAERLLGYPTSDWLKPGFWLEHLHPDDREWVPQYCAACTGRAEPHDFEYRFVARDGRTVWLHDIVTVVEEGGGPRWLRGIMVDVTARKRTEEVIWNQANFDALTSLPNRRLFQDRLSQEIRRARRNGTLLALLFIDIDRFKEVNDTLGHGAGDALLREIGQRVRGGVRSTDTTARLGGDEFTVIVPDVADPADIQPIARNLIGTLRKPFQVGGHTVYLSASIGIALFPDDGADVDHLVKSADQAMFSAKDSGRNSFCYFTPSMQREAFRRMNLGTELRGALAAGQLRMHFQPIVSLPDARIVKAEALMRWFHPILGQVSPAEFIPLAESLGVIHEIGDWAFQESARWAKAWMGETGVPIQVSVNKSPRQFMAGDTQETWLAHLQAMELPSSAISIEITEGLLLSDHQHVAAKLERFRRAGVQISLDDFGTGYSALSYLKKFRIDYLKLDQSFVKDIATNPSSQAIADAVIAMAHKLGLKVIAEGIEAQEQLEVLLWAGCDYGQGYLFSRAVPPEEFRQLLLAQAGQGACALLS